MTRPSVGQWGDERIEPGDSREILLAVSEGYLGISLAIPIFVRRATEPGPVVFVTAALHGDEINGTGAIRHLIQDDSFQLLRGSAILVPVLNVLSFERHTRYLPDRRDLNRCFPGSAKGSLASRVARSIFQEIVHRSDFGIDLHTASVRRTNYPTVRGDLQHAKVRELALAFGSEILMNGRGPKGALRREACHAGRPTIIMEGGEVWKVEPSIVQTATRGIRNVFRHLGMIEGEIELPSYQVTIEHARWVRAEEGGFLQFHVQPGEVVDQGQPLASNTTIMGQEQSVLTAPFSGVILGMTTLPAVSPGEPVCHLGKLPEGMAPNELRRLRRMQEGIEEGVVQDLASNVLVVEPLEPERDQPDGAEPQ